MHGDFKYDNIQNTDDELKKLEGKVIERSEQLLQTGRLVIIGYAGNDNSIMSMLEKGLTTNLYPNGIIWCKLKESNLNERVTEFMKRACAQNQNSAVADISGFDVLLHRIYRSKQFDNHTIEEIAKADELKALPIIFHKQKETSVFLKTNAFFKLEMPSSCLSFETDIKTWKKEIINNTSVIAGLHKGKIISFSTKEIMAEVFSSHIKAKIVETQFAPPLFKGDTSVEMGLCYDIIEYDLINNRKLVKSGKRRYYDPHKLSSDKQYYEAIEIGLTFIGSIVEGKSLTIFQNLKAVLNLKAIKGFCRIILDLKRYLKEN